MAEAMGQAWQTHCYFKDASAVFLNFGEGILLCVTFVGNESASITAMDLFALHDRCCPIWKKVETSWRLGIAFAAGAAGGEVGVWVGTGGVGVGVVVVVVVVVGVGVGVGAGVGVGVKVGVDPINLEFSDGWALAMVEASPIGGL